jgi:hypothetical protein
MKKMSTKGALLFGAVMAICAFALPSMASAASWSVVGTTHQLVSTNLVIDPTTSPVSWTCADSELDVDVASAATLEITGASFRACGGLQGGAGCLVTTTGTRFPWTVTAPTTTNIQIHGIHIDARFENNGGFACPVAGLTFTVTGTLSGGTWDPSATGASRRITLNQETGTTSHTSVGSPIPTEIGGTFRDTAGTLNLFD